MTQRRISKIVNDTPKKAKYCKPEFAVDNSFVMSSDINVWIRGNRKKENKPLF